MSTKQNYKDIFTHEDAKCRNKINVKVQKFPCWYCINCWIIKLLRIWWFKSWVHCVCGTCKN